MSSYLTLARDGGAEIEVKHSRFRCTLARVESELRSRGVVVLDTAYAERVSLLLGVPPDGAEPLHALVAGLTGGGAAAVTVGERWVDAR